MPAVFLIIAVVVVFFGLSLIAGEWLARRKSRRRRPIMGEGDKDRTEPVDPGLTA